jgi:hypothetical protein
VMYFFSGEALAVALEGPYTEVMESLAGPDTGILAIIFGSIGSGSSIYLISKVF